MVNFIVDLFKNEARMHKSIKSFHYDRNYELGAGHENHPVFWLEDPIIGRNKQNVFECTVNFSILLIPKYAGDELKYQDLSFSIGLNILERLKQQDNEVSILPSWDFITLREYYDNNACGCRFSVNMVIRNMQDLCLIEEQFDKSKQFEKKSSLSEFQINKIYGNEVFNDKLPVFDIKTSKK